MVENQAIAAVTPGAVVKEEFGGQQLSVSAETSSTAVAAQVQAQIQARYVMALRKPRDLMQVRTKLLQECQRPGFAKIALYSKPVGGSTPAVGFTIRFAEAAVRCMTNLCPEVTSIYDDAKKRIVRVSVTDIESNVSYATDITQEKTTERSFLRRGQACLGVRTNSKGQPTYLVEATEAELENNVNAHVSKVIRNLVLRLVPGDIQEDCRAKIDETLAADVAQDPKAAIKRIVDSFAAIGIEPRHLADYLGHDVAQCVPAEVVELRTIYAAIKDGETTWSDIMAEKAGADDADTDGDGDGKSRARGVRERLKALAAEDDAPPQEA